MYHPDVATFLADYSDEDLWSFQPGRSHRGYLDFVHTMSLGGKPVNMGKRMRQLARDLDDWRNLQVDDDHIPE
jgi:hypothetical protein